VTSATRPSIGRGAGIILALAALDQDARARQQVVVVVGEFQRIVAGEAGVAVLRAGGVAGRAADGAVEAVHRDEGEAVAADRLRHFGLGHAGGHQVFAFRRVDAVEAGEHGGRRGNPHVDLGCSGVAHHIDDLLRGGAAHDGIVHQDDPLALDHFGVRAVLQLHPEVADRIRRLDEGAPDVVVADDPQFEGNPRGLGIAERGGHPGIRHRDDQVGVHRPFVGKFRADPLARLVDALAVHQAVGAGEIDVLENAQALLVRGEGLLRVQPGLVDDHHLAGFDVAHEVRADDVEGAGFGGQDIGLAQLADDQGAHPAGSRTPISASVDSITREYAP
jgi:hypothetical protein